MTRLLLILAFVATGIVPGAVCRQAVAGSGASIAAMTPADSCGMNCCEMACCCVAEPAPSSHPSPDTPATPPRGADVLPLTLHVLIPLYALEASADPGREWAQLLAEARLRPNTSSKPSPVSAAG
ncbi:MAG: hypothetical protein AAGL98_10505 [Planctomycetota bacterium]